MPQKHPPLQAITFDFWRTLFYAHSRLPERRRARVEAVVRIAGVSAEAAKDALKQVGTETLRIHIAHRRTLDHREVIPILEHQLGLAFSIDQAVVLADAIADAFVLHPPEPIKGGLEALREAAARVRVGIISDTGISPGSRIQMLLEQRGYLEHITSLSFSDEVGAAKPDAKMFEHAAAGLKVEAADLLHIGDLEPTDVSGARDFGARAALFAADNDRYVAGSQAEFVFHSWREFVEALPGIVG